jgi:hypothetical protein
MLLHLLLKPQHLLHLMPLCLLHLPMLLHLLHQLMLLHLLHQLMLLHLLHLPMRLLLLHLQLSNSARPPAVKKADFMSAFFIVVDFVSLSRIG